MDKRLDKLLKSGIELADGCMLDTYNQQVQKNVSCTIRTNINTANHHFVVEKDMSEIKYIGKMSSSQNSRVIDPEGISYAVTNGHKDGEPKIIEYEKPVCVGNILPNKSKCGRDMQAGRVYDSNGISPCLTVMSGGNTEPKIIERNTPMKGNYKEPRICTMVGRDPNNLSSRSKSEHYEQMLELGDDISNTLTSVQKDNLLAEPIKPTDVCIQVGNIYPDSENMSNRSGGRVYSKDGCSPTILSRDFKTPKLVAEPLRIPQATKQGYIEVPPGAVFDMSYPDSTTRRGRVQDGGKVSPTLMAGGETPCLFEGVAENTHIKEVAEELKQMATDARKEPIEVTINKYGSLRPHKLDKAKTGVSEFQVENEEDTASTLISARPNKTYGLSTSYRIRKLTPRECFRLMGVTENDIDKIRDSGVSQSQQYKMAGNSIVVDCLYHMFRKLFTETACESQQLSLF